MDYPRYDPAIDTPPLSDAELDGLDALLQALPADNVMNVESLDGYLTGLLVGPPLLQRLDTAAWLPVVWGGDGSAGPAETPLPFGSQKQRKRAALLVLRHLHAIDHALRTAPERWEPVFSVADDGERELVDAEEWCIGFLQAVALDNDAWAPIFDTAELGQALVPVVLLGADDSGLDPADLQRLSDPEERDRISRAAADAVLLLQERRSQGPAA